MGKDDRDELASKKVVWAREEPTREAGRGVVVLGLSGVVLVVVLLPPSEATFAGLACGFFTDLLLRLELKAEGGFEEVVVLEICREPKIQQDQPRLVTAKQKLTYHQRRKCLDFLLLRHYHLYPYFV
jgi:hypothetical protein